MTQKLVDRQRKFSEVAISSKQVDDISLSLERIETSLHKAFQLADQLNMILPEKDRYCLYYQNFNFLMQVYIMLNKHVF